MRILWLSVSPMAPTGYGAITREAVKRLVKAGHVVRVGCKHWVPAMHLWFPGGGLAPVEVFDATNTLLVNQMLEAERFDYIWTLIDIEMLAERRKYPKEKWVGYFPVDTIEMSDCAYSVATEIGLPVAMSRHGEAAMKARGLEPMYAPHAVDFDVFKIKPAHRAAWRHDLGYDDSHFVIGSVGRNNMDDRKGFLPLFQAFKIFHERHPEARLYLHTNLNAGYHAEGEINYQKCIDNLGIGEWVTAIDQAAYALARVEDEWVADAYNGMDVMCLPTRGEGFGIPLVEAQACGTPVVTTATTSGPELIKNGVLIKTTDDDRMWLPGGAWRHVVRPSAIVEALENEYGYIHAADSEWLRKDVREGMIPYSWDSVWPTYFEPVIAEMERRLDARRT